MKPLYITKIYGLVLIALTIIIVIQVEYSLNPDMAFGQEINNITKKYDIVLLSHIYSSTGVFADELMGEILNNGTATVKAVEITAIFYDDQDDIIDNERSGTSPYTVNPGDKAIFTIEIFDEAIKSNASSYEFTAKWKDEYLASSYFTRLIGGEISVDDKSGEENNEDDDN